MFKKAEGFINNIRFFLIGLLLPKGPKEDKVRVAFLKMLKKFPLVSIGVDTTHLEVVIPKHLLGVGDIELQYGLNLANPIPDLDVGYDGISATLSFNRIPFKTFIPWAAVKWMKAGQPGPVGPSGGTPNLIVLKGGNLEARQDVGKAAA